MNSARKYFGTDGIRGVAGQHPLTAAFALRLGEALAELLRPSSGGGRFVVGTDTRISGTMLAQALLAGLAARGADALFLGVMPTPAVAHLTRTLDAAAGVVVSASHNPFADNGIKIFGPGGLKLGRTLEAEIEAFLDGSNELPEVTHGAVGRISDYTDDEDAYYRFLLEHAPFLDGLKVGLDCAHGAASEVAPRVFRQIGARLDLIGAEPDGVNINDGCGSTSPGLLQERVRGLGLDAGVTFDGDADRALLVDARGRLVTGDHMLGILAVTRGEQEVVATVMSNLGLEHFLEERGIRLHRTDVGDRFVGDELRRRGLTLGGEQSGHMLMLDRAPTGDGILTALQVLAAVRQRGMDLEEWVDLIPVYPQRLTNVEVPAGSKHAVVEHPELLAAVSAAAERLGDDGRVNVRPSGTEALVRVMVEAADGETVDSVSAGLVDAVRRVAEADDALAQSAAE